MHTRGYHVRSGQWGLGQRASAYDGELFALAGGASATVLLCTQMPHISSIIFLTDSTTAARNILNTSAHPGQSVSVLYHKHMTTLFSLQTNNIPQVTIMWIPGHSNLAGHTRADTLAKDATSLPPLLHSTITQAREHSMHKAIKAWCKEWHSRPHHNFSSLAKRDSPSLHLTSFHKNFHGSRQLHCKLIQVLLGHCFIGEYYRRFVPSVPSACPCGAAVIQTIAHTLFVCPIHTSARHHLYSHSTLMTMPILLSTASGLSALRSFLHDTTAFSPTPVDSPSQYTAPFPPTLPSDHG